MARKSKIQFPCKIKSDMRVNDASVGKSTAETLSGFDINGTMAFGVKRSEKENKCALYRINSFETASAPSDVRVLPVKSYGMTYYAQNLYIAGDNNKIARVPYGAGDTTTDMFDVISMDGTKLNSRAITNVSGSKFILMANALNESGEYLCFSECTLNAGAKKFEETGRFYVKASGYSMIKDIYCDTNYGLFIVTNKPESGGVANSNLILRVSLDRKEANGYKGRDLYYPTQQYYFVGNTDDFTAFHIESVAIASKGENIGKMYAVASVTTKAGEKADRMLHFTNFTFDSEGIFTITVGRNNSVDVDIPNSTGVYNGENYECDNAGAMALDGEVGYCLVSDTSGECANAASVLLKTSDVNAGPFKKIAPGNSVYTEMGHGNGMTYYNGALYIAAYVRNVRNAIVKLSTDGTKLGEYLMDSGICIGSISHYRDNLFILGEYNPSPNTYAFEPKFYIGYFENNRFVKTKTFSVKNPAYDTAKSNFLQDIHYDDEFGLYYITLTGKCHMFRVTAEQIEQAGSAAIEPVEWYEFDSSLASEQESLSISTPTGAVGAMHIACNGDGNQDKMYKVNGLKFYR